MQGMKNQKKYKLTLTINKCEFFTVDTTIIIYDWDLLFIYIACFEKKIQFGNSINKNSQNLIRDIAILCVFICAISEKEIAEI